MTRKINLLIITLALGIFGSAVSAAAEDAALEAVRAKMGAMFEEIEAEDIKASPIDGWYTVHKGSIVAYISQDGRYLLQGDLIDLDRQMNLSEITRTDARRDLISTIDNDQAIVFSPAVVKHSVTIFTDVDCTYCRKLHGEIDDYLAAGIEIRYMLYPRNGPASSSWNISEDVWCARDRNLALTAAKLGRAFDSQSCASNAVTESYMLGQNVGLSGTPAIVFEDGTLVSGYLPPAALSMRLESMAAK